MSLESRLAKLEQLRARRRAQKRYDPERDGPLVIVLEPGDQDPVLQPGWKPLIIDCRGTDGPGEGGGLRDVVRLDPEDGKL